MLIPLLPEEIGRRLIAQGFVPDGCGLKTWAITGAHKAAVELSVSMIVTQERFEQIFGKQEPLADGRGSDPA